MWIIEQYTNLQISWFYFFKLGEKFIEKIKVTMFFFL